MKRIDFENGTVTRNILGAALPMLIAQILNLLYNIVDRIYISRIPDVGTRALGAVGLCFPVITIITAFANLFGGGGAPLFSIYPRSERGTQGRSDYEYFLYYAVFWCDCPHERWTLDRQTSASVIWCFCGYTSLCTAVHNDLSDRHTAIHDCCRNESIYQCTRVRPDRHVLCGCRRCR